jgi:hypothetical protein
MMILSRFGLTLAISWVVAAIVSAAQIDDAAALYDDGKYPEAHAALQGVLAGSPSASEVAQARYYTALALFEMEKFDECIEAVGQARQQSAELTAEQLAALNSKIVRSHYAGKNFQATRSEAQAFLQALEQTAGTTETKYMRFINSKAMWDMARKDYIDAARARERGKDDSALKDGGAAKMQQFLGECNDFTAGERNEFVVAKKMSLKQMTWHARILAGEEEQLVAEMESAPAEDQVAFAYYRAWAHYYFWPENRTKNHDMLKAFAEAHPDYEWAPRARYFAAKILHRECVELLARTKNISLKYDSKELQPDALKLRAMETLSAFLEECEEGESLGAFSLDPNIDDGLGSKYREISVVLRDENAAATKNQTLSPAGRAKADFEVALGIYRTYGTSEWGKALEMMDRAAATAEDVELKRSATNYGMAIEYNRAMFLLRTAYTDPPGMDGAATSATKDQEGMRLVQAFIDDYEAAQSANLLPGKASARTLAEERYWECRFIADTGDALLQESQSWPDEKRARLVNMQFHAYYHSNQWERCRMAAQTYRAMPGVPEADLLDVDVDLFETYELTRGYAELAGVADALAAQYDTGSKLWANALNARAIGKAMKPEPDLAGAAADLDQVLAANIEHADLQNHIPTRAAYWRAYVAEAEQDTATLRNVARMIRDDMPDNPYRNQAISRYKEVLQ